jgi:uncharacterized protein (DUF433 family)
MTAYIEAREGNLYIGQSRVTLQTLIEAWQSGRTPEQLQDSFPTLPLVAIYGAITHYLEHKDESDVFFRRRSVSRGLLCRHASAYGAGPPASGR